MKHSRFAYAVIVSVLAVAAAGVWACSTPVFRYALERWPADAYLAFVFHRGELTAQQKQAVAALRVRDANVQTFVVDLDDDASAPLKSLWEAQKDATLPWLVVRYPRVSGIKEDAWAGPLTVENAKQIVESPARREIERRLIKGDSTVWVLLESGDPAKDAAAKKTLQTALKQAKKEIQLPPDFLETLAADGSGAPAPKVAFSMVTVSRTDPAEKAFVDLLLHTEPDLKDFDEPIAFPVFGRGRALYAFVGKGINEENTFEACYFLLGPCSCQVKELNPGTDIIMAVDWDQKIMDQYVQDDTLPPLTGYTELAAEAQPDEEKALANETAEDQTAAAQPESSPAEPAAVTPQPEPKSANERAIVAKAAVDAPAQPEAAQPQPTAPASAKPAAKPQPKAAKPAPVAKPIPPKPIPVSQRKPEPPPVKRAAVEPPVEVETPDVTPSDEGQAEPETRIAEAPTTGQVDVTNDETPAESGAVANAASTSESEPTKEPNPLTRNLVAVLGMLAVCAIAATLIIRAKANR